MGTVGALVARREATETEVQIESIDWSDQAAQWLRSLTSRERGCVGPAHTRRKAEDLEEEEGPGTALAIDFRVGRTFCAPRADRAARAIRAGR